MMENNSICKQPTLQTYLSQEIFQPLSIFHHKTVGTFWILRIDIAFLYIPLVPKTYIIHKCMETPLITSNAKLVFNFRERRNILLGKKNSSEATLLKLTL